MAKKKQSKDTSLKDKLVALGRKFDEKVKEEVAQFNEMGGIGEYVAHNATTLLVKGAEVVGRKDAAQKIEEKRAKVLAQGKKFDKKVKEEVAQFSEMGGIGEYVAHNATTLLAKGGEAVGREDVAKKIEGKRTEMLAQGKKIDKKVKEEVAQFNEMGGIGEYVAYNATTLLAKGAWAYGDDELVQRIESKREEIVAQGKAFDKKVQEEYQQLQDLGGVTHVGEYAAQNANTLLVQGARAIGLDGVAKKIEDDRNKFLALGTKIDNKIKEETMQFRQSGGVGEYLAQNISEGYDDFKSARVNISIPKVGELEFNVSDPKSPVVSLKDDAPKAVLVQGCPVLSNKPESTDKLKSGNIPLPFAYKKAELSVQKLSDGATRECSIIDGKKHGTEVIRDGQNQILDIKLYNHGHRVDLINNKLDIRQEVSESGVVHNYCLLNNQKFGTETFADSSGKTITTFYEEGGFVMNRDEHSQITTTAIGENKKIDKALLAKIEHKQSSR